MIGCTCKTKNGCRKCWRTSVVSRATKKTQEPETPCIWVIVYQLENEDVLTIVNCELVFRADGNIGGEAGQAIRKYAQLGHKMTLKFFN